MLFRFRKDIVKRKLVVKVLGKFCCFKVAGWVFRVNKF